MNYNALLDAFFSAPLSYLLLGTYIVVILLLRKRLFPARRRKVAKAFFVIIFPALWLIAVGLLNPYYWGYGKPFAIASVTAIDGKLYVMDYELTSGGKDRTAIPCFRMHVTDPKTGEKKRRFLVGNHGGYIVCVQGDTMAFTHSGDVAFYSVSTGSELSKWSVKTLPALFPQLAAGVRNLERVDTIVEVNSLDGNKYDLNILHKRLGPHDDYRHEKYKPTNKLIIQDKKYIRIDNERIYPTEVLHLGEVAGAYNKQVICYRDSVLNRYIIFLLGEIVALSEKDSCFVVKDYDNTNREGVDYTCMSLDGKRKLWELRQRTVRPGDSKDAEMPSAGCIDRLNNIFIAGMKNELIAVRMSDGKILWREVP